MKENLYTFTIEDSTMKENPHTFTIKAPIPVLVVTVCFFPLYRVLDFFHRCDLSAEILFDMRQFHGFIYGQSL